MTFRKKGCAPRRAPTHPPACKRRALGHHREPAVDFWCYPFLHLPIYLLLTSIYYGKAPRPQNGMKHVTFRKKGCAPRRAPTHPPARKRRALGHHREPALDFRCYPFLHLPTSLLLPSVHYGYSLRPRNGKKLRIIFTPYPRPSRLLDKKRQFQTANDLDRNHSKKMTIPGC